MALGIQAKFHVVLTKELLGTHSYLNVLIGFVVVFVVFLGRLLIFGDGLGFVFSSTFLSTFGIQIWLTPCCAFFSALGIQICVPVDDGFS